MHEFQEGQVGHSLGNLLSESEKVASCELLWSVAVELKSKLAATFWIRGFTRDEIIVMGNEIQMRNYK